MTSDTKESDYILRSEEEIKRLSSQHEVIKDAMGGLLYTPVDLKAQSLRILDSATADGTWIRDLKSSCPSSDHTFVGTDIDPTQFPESSPKGTSYQVQDMREPWPQDWNSSFDIVHQRVGLAGAGPKGKMAVQNLGQLVKPGGWIQLIEGENILPDSEGPAMHDFIQLIKDIFGVMGNSPDMAREMGGWLKESGFVDIQEKVVTVQMGASNPDPELAKQGVYSNSVAVKGLAAFAKTLAQENRSFSDKKLDALESEMQNELTERGGGFPLRVVWARKPYAKDCYGYSSS